ncbi:hypothetical protein DKM28_12030 [Methanosarcina mazei]|uniref:Uncharacterized protein n=1 Tax=Methanosarcina mazei TaxID=2209 RepID=A0A4P8R189_METMZ|nr:hypothetical protein DKM28_12030 [Methanosarcina mazei]
MKGFCFLAGKSYVFVQ